MTSPNFFFPGETISEDSLPIPKNPKASLQLGPGLRLAPPSTIISTIAGDLRIDRKKNTVWLEPPSSKYIPLVGDLVIAQVLRSASEAFICSITPHTSNALLSHLAFPNATKKTRPQLVSGTLVYARISQANKHFDPELECVNPSTNKADGLGELKGGTVFNVSPAFARRLLMGDGKGDIAVLGECSEKISFEIAIGRNGLVWIDSKDIKSTLIIGKALEETDRKILDVDAQRKLARAMLKTI